MSCCHSDAYLSQCELEHHQPALNLFKRRLVWAGRPWHGEEKTLSWANAVICIIPKCAQDEIKASPGQQTLWEPLNNKTLWPLFSFCLSWASCLRWVMHIARGIQREQACVLPLVPDTFWSVGCPREPLGPRVLPSLLARGKEQE